MTASLPKSGSAFATSLVWRAIVVLALGLAVLAICHFTPPPVALAQAGVVMHLPDTAAGLQGKTEDASEAEKTVLPHDTQIVKKIYSHGPGEELHCEIVLSGSDRRSIHRPEACLRGQGWTIINGGTIPVKLNDGTTMNVMRLIIDRPVQDASGRKHTLRSLYLYWFASKTLLTPLHSERLFRTYYDLLFASKTHRWAYIIVSAPVLRGFSPGGLNEDQTLDLMKRFIAEAAPQFQRVDIQK